MYCYIINDDTLASEGEISYETFGTSSDFVSFGFGSKDNAPPPKKVPPVPTTLEDGEESLSVWTEAVDEEDGEESLSVWTEAVDEEDGEVLICLDRGSG